MNQSTIVFTFLQYYPIKGLSMGVDVSKKLHGEVRVGARDGDDRLISPLMLELPHIPRHAIFQIPHTF